MRQRWTRISQSAQVYASWRVGTSGKIPDKLRILLMKKARPDRELAVK
jgi:hypothetical protein